MNGDGRGTKATFQFSVGLNAIRNNKKSGNYHKVHDESFNT